MGDRIYPDAGTGFASAPAPPGAYYNLKQQNEIPPPATYQRPRRHRNPCCCCLLSICSIFIFLVVALGLAVLIFWLVVHPKAPRFDVNTVHLSGFTGTTGPYNTNITYRITATNPNKHVDFYYSDISVFVQAGGDNVGQGTVPDFNQGHHNVTVIDGEIGETGVNIDQSTLSTLTKDLTKVPFYAEVDLKAKLKIGSAKSGKIKVKVKCDIFLNLNVQSGSQLNGHSCKVHW